MKHTVHILRICAVLLLLALLAGCTQKQEPQTPNAEEDNVAQATFLSRIALLEAQLQEQKEAQYTAEIRYDAQLEALRKQMAALGSGTSTPSIPVVGGETLTFNYVLEGNDAIVTGFTGNCTLLNIPAQLDGHNVVGIGERAFEGTTVAAVTLPEGLRHIGWFAFYECANLRDVTIPSSVTSIGYGVFDGCPYVNVVCEKGSYAAMFADSYGLPCVLKQGE